MTEGSLDSDYHVLSSVRVGLHEWTEAQVGGMLVWRRDDGWSIEQQPMEQAIADYFAGSPDGPPWGVASRVAELDYAIQRIVEYADGRVVAGAPQAYHWTNEGGPWRFVPVVAPAS